MRITKTGDHGTLVGLTDDDHTVYLKEDGTDDMDGNLDLNAFDLILDADSDSYIHAIADDEIEVITGGSNPLSITNSGIWMGSNLPFTSRGAITVPDGTAAAPGLRLTGYNHGVYSASSAALGLTVNGVSAMTIGATSAYFVGSAYVTGAGAWNFNGRSKLTSPADGNLILDRAAGGQGVLFNTATTDGMLALTDEAGAALTLSVGTVSSNIWRATGAMYLRYLPAGGLDIVPDVLSTAATGGNLRLGTADQTNAGNYASGKVSVYSGATTTDGDTGDMEIYSGAAGAGAADAGDLLFAVNGAPGSGQTVLKLTGATGALSTPAKTKTLAAAADTFAVTAPVMIMTGDGGGNTVATITGGESGTRLTLIFVDAFIAITDTAYAGRAANNVSLSGAFTGAGGTVLELIHDGTAWLETGRSING